MSDEKKQGVDEAMDELMKGAKVRRPDQIKGPARVLKANDLKAFIQKIVESISGSSNAEIVARLSESEMKLGQIKGKATQLAQQVAHLQAQLSDEQAKMADQLAQQLAEAQQQRNELKALLEQSQREAQLARDAAAMAEKAQRDAVLAKTEAEANAAQSVRERDIAIAEAEDLREQLRLIDNFGEAADLARELARLRREYKELQIASEFADLHAELDLPAVQERLRSHISDAAVPPAGMALGSALMRAAAESEALIDQLRASIHAGEGTLGMVTKLIEVQARGELLSECSDALVGLDEAAALSETGPLPDLPLDGGDGAGGEDDGGEVVLETAIPDLPTVDDDLSAALDAVGGFDDLPELEDDLIVDEE
ncbi:MAG: hypothetical protein ACYTGX_02395 [Planctomycetota bacterium]|jgi:hypothetical protein